MGPHARSDGHFGGAPVFDDILESPEFRDYHVTNQGFYNDCCCQIIPCICKSYQVMTSYPHYMSHNLL